jgi:hypothetical protein
MNYSPPSPPISSCSSLHQPIGALNASLIIYEECWEEKGKLIFFITQTGRFTYRDCGATERYSLSMLEHVYSKYMSTLYVPYMISMDCIRYSEWLTLFLGGGAAPAAAPTRRRRALRRNEAAVALFATNQRDAAEPGSAAAANQLIRGSAPAAAQQQWDAARPDALKKKTAVKIQVNKSQGEKWRNVYSKLKTVCIFT